MTSKPNQPGSRRRTVSIRTKLLFSVGVVLLCLVVLEGFARYTGRFAPPPYPPVCERPELYEAYEPYGYRLHVSSTMQYSYPRDNPRQLTLVSNENGFRDSHDPNEPHDGLRVLVLGDSFVFGDGVEQAERFTDRLERLRPEWRVENMGMTGYGLDTMLRAYEVVGVQIPADILLVCVYSDDFRRVMPHYAGVGFKIPRYRLEDGELVTVAYPRPRSWDRSHLVQLWRRAHWKLTGAEWKLNTAILDRLVARADQRACDTALVFLPGRSDTHKDVERRKWLGRYAREHGIAFLDVTDAILAVGDTAFIANNWHYNSAGHQIVAEELSQFISQREGEK